MQDLRYEPCYGVIEAAHYLRIPVSTLRSWVKGQPNFEPIIKIAEKKPPLLSFINLVEAFVLSSIRREYFIPMPKVRGALQYVSKHFNSEHPLADKKFSTDGIDLFLQESEAIINVSQKGQLALNILKTYLQRIEHDKKGLANRLYPFTRTGRPDEPKLIVIIPDISFGRPVLIKTGIPVDVIAERYQAGETIKELMTDYDRSQEEIEEAIRCELGIRKAA
ncbi:MAG: DUF433 domain-containing protein [Candidatus Dadabacteria bacterium]|nr:DUF433 domain-containing protein [Candidatus Dadabacteria bacterium]